MIFLALQNESFLERKRLNKNSIIHPNGKEGNYLGPWRRAKNRLGKKSSQSPKSQLLPLEKTRWSGMDLPHDTLSLESITTSVALR